MSVTKDGMSKPKDLFVEYRQGILHFVKFNIVGILNTGLTIAVYNILLLSRIDELVAYPIGYCAGLVNSFIFNKMWTFERRKSFHPSEAAKFAIVNLLALGGGQLLLYINKTSIGIVPVVAQLLTLVYSVPTNFIGSKYWVFRDKQR